MNEIVTIALVAAGIVVGVALYWVIRKGKTSRVTPTSKATATPEATKDASQPDSPTEFIAAIPATAEQQVKSACELFEEILDYSEASIAKLDEIIEKGWPEGPPALLEPTVNTFGAYLGETIRRNLGGEWGHSDEEGYFLDNVAGSAKLYPFMRIEKRFIEGSEESLGFYYAAAKEVIKEEV